MLSSHLLRLLGPGASSPRVERYVCFPVLSGRVLEANRRSGAGDGRDSAGQRGGYPWERSMGSFTTALASFYLPELAALHSSELVVHAVLNKTDLEGTLSRSDVLKVVKPFFPEAEVFLTSKNNRNSVRSVFKSMLGTVQIEKWLSAAPVIRSERGCFSCKRWYVCCEKVYYEETQRSANKQAMTLATVTQESTVGQRRGSQQPSTRLPPPPNTQTHPR